MSWIDYLIFAVYMFGVLAIGAYHYFRNKNSEDYYVGSRGIALSTLVFVPLSLLFPDPPGGHTARDLQ